MPPCSACGVLGIVNESREVRIDHRRSLLAVTSLLTARRADPANSHAPQCHLARPWPYLGPRESGDGGATSCKMALYRPFIRSSRWAGNLLHDRCPRSREASEDQDSMHSWAVDRGPRDDSGVDSGRDERGPAQPLPRDRRRPCQGHRGRETGVRAARCPRGDHGGRAGLQVPCRPPGAGAS